MRVLYLKLLRYLCRKELKRIANNYPHTRDELINYHDFMMISWRLNVSTVERKPKTEY